jgi:hypothetical protein
VRANQNLGVQSAIFESLGGFVKSTRISGSQTEVSPKKKKKKTRISCNDYSIVSWDLRS